MTSASPLTLTLKRLFPSTARYGNFNGSGLTFILRRYVAWSADYVIGMLLIDIISEGILHLPRSETAYNYNLYQPLRELICLGYYMLTFRGRHQATWGMRLVKLKLVSGTDDKPSLRQCLIYYGILSTYDFWDRRLWYVLIIGCGFTEADIVHPHGFISGILGILLSGGKVFTLCLLVVPMFFTEGRQSFANVRSRTKLICTQSSRHA